VRSFALANCNWPNYSLLVHTGYWARHMRTRSDKSIVVLVNCTKQQCRDTDFKEILGAAEVHLEVPEDEELGNARYQIHIMNFRFQTNLIVEEGEDKGQTG